MSWNPVPPVIETAVHTAMPDALRKTGVVSDWSRANKGGEAIDCFIEGPCFDPQGNLYIVDIPHGRIFQITPSLEWRAIATYDGEPNGLAWHPQHKLIIADYKNGVMKLDPARGEVEPLLARRNSERFKGVNDLIVASNGDIYFTDQGQTGLHDPTGRVFRLTTQGRLDCLIDNGPSPNGLVLDGKEKVLFVAMTRDNTVWRLPLLPDVPTVGETVPGYELAVWYGAFGPAGMDPKLVDKLNKAINAVLAKPEVVKQMGDIGVEVLQTTPQQFSRTLVHDEQKYDKLIRSLGVTADDDQ